MYQVPSLQDFEDLRAAVHTLKAEVATLKAKLPEWVREAEAQQLTGLSQATLARERKKPGTLLEVTSSGPLRYKRSSLEAFNEARTLRRARLAA
jgi:hypothetical protein